MREARQGGHSCIGTLPIVYFGTPEQKAKYLPRLATAEIVGAYALTESGAGSDALAARSTAVLTGDGRAYRLNGTKQYISNAGFADLFIVFAKAGGDKFTAFIVERDTPGFTVGAEERKMGIKGSSTRALAFDDALVPVENVLGAIGLGHVVAFNILNVGRFKLGASAVGGCKGVLEHNVPYVKERRQFGRPLSDFGVGVLRLHVHDGDVRVGLGRIEDDHRPLRRHRPPRRNREVRAGGGRPRGVLLHRLGPSGSRRLAEGGDGEKKREAECHEGAPKHETLRAECPTPPVLI